MIKLLFNAAFIILFFSACRPVNENQGDLYNAGQVDLKINYASGFSITKHNNGDKIIKVTNPWQEADNVMFTYHLSDTASESRLINQEHFLIKTPVKNVVCLSTTHIGFVDLLGKIYTINGISGKEYVVNQQLLKMVSSGQVRDVGYEENLNYELIIDIKPDVVFAYGITSSVSRMVNRLNELGIPVVMVGEYLEEDPLARLEWLKFFAAFYDMEDTANLVFDSISSEYLRLTSIAEVAEDEPVVMLGLPWRDTWYISGGKSYSAKLIEDAGGSYLWNSLDFKDSRPINPERVFEQALNAEFWLNAGDANSKRDIFIIDERLKVFPAFINGNVYNNNKLLSTTGGNAYFETGVVEPHIILSDIIKILHPYLLPSHELKYYKKLD